MYTGSLLDKNTILPSLELDGCKQPTYVVQHFLQQQQINKVCSKALPHAPAKTPIKHMRAYAIYTMYNIVYVYQMYFLGKFQHF